MDTADHAAISAAIERISATADTEHATATLDHLLSGDHWSRMTPDVQELAIIEALGPRARCIWHTAEDANHPHRLTIEGVAARVTMSFLPARRDTAQWPRLEHVRAVELAYGVPASAPSARRGTRRWRLNRQLGGRLAVAMRLRAEVPSLLTGIDQSPPAGATGSGKLTWDGGRRALLVQRSRLGETAQLGIRIASSESDEQWYAWWPITDAMARALRLLNSAISWTRDVPLLTAEVSILTSHIARTISAIVTRRLDPPAGLKWLIRFLRDDAAPPTDWACCWERLRRTTTVEQPLARALADALAAWCGPHRLSPLGARHGGIGELHRFPHDLCHLPLTVVGPVTRTASQLRWRGNLRTADGLEPFGRGRSPVFGHTPVAARMSGRRLVVSGSLARPFPPARPVLIEFPTRRRRPNLDAGIESAVGEFLSEGFSVDGVNCFGFGGHNSVLVILSADSTLGEVTAAQAGLEAAFGDVALIRVKRVGDG